MQIGASQITNVFVLMLENHSFDNIFAMSGIEGIRVANTGNSNCWLNKKYCVNDRAPPFMTTDPGHEFEDVGTQLCGLFCYETGKPYPPVNNSGFACSYATSTSESTGTPSDDHIGDIMACFQTQTQLPVIYQLATEFALCDHWFSSMPGPTWPNRFFVHGASSAGLDRSPKLEEEIDWLTYEGFQYQNGSIFDALKAAHQDQPDHQYRIYNDFWNRYTDQPSSLEDGGWISQVAALKNIHQWDVHPLDSFFEPLSGRPPSADNFARDLKGDYPYKYTFIEPNFGTSFGTPLTYKAGSSQHPEDDCCGGERLIKAVYEAIRNSPLWNTSLLVIVYDEHGGFYDHVKPLPATPPGDKTMDNYVAKLNGFDFSLYGVRVPAVIVSPLIPKGTVATSIYDHSSIPRTLEQLFMPGRKSLTNRSQAAEGLLGLLTLSQPRPDADCPRVLDNPAPPVTERPVLTAEMIEKMSQQPLPETGNMIGFLHVLLKAALRGADATEQASIIREFNQITTIGAARAFSGRIGTKIAAALKSAE